MLMYFKYILLNFLMYVSIYLIEFQIQTKIDTHLGKNLQ